MNNSYKDQVITVLEIYSRKCSPIISDPYNIKQFFIDARNRDLLSENEFSYIKKKIRSKKPL